MFDFCIEMHLLNTTLNVLILQQQIFQARWYTDHPLLCLPHLSAHSIEGIGFVKNLLIKKCFFYFKSIMFHSTN